MSGGFSGGSDSGGIEASVTLEEVIAVVSEKRVPLAPELGGYIVLEIAAQAEPRDGTIHASNVVLTEEGVLALVHPRTAADGDPARAIRSLLQTLLGASGSTTPALTAVVRRSEPSSIASVAAELEAALIPVNRAAGKRATARLVREVRRVLLGVGRNASRERPSSIPPSNHPLRPSRPPVVKEVEPAKNEEENIGVLLDEIAVKEGLTPEPESAAAPNPAPVPNPAPAPAPVPVPIPVPAPDRDPAPQDDAPLIVGDFDMPPGDPEVVLPPVSMPAAERSDVDKLLAQFATPRVDATDLTAMSAELKSLAGLDPTPPPPSVAPASAAPSSPIRPSSIPPELSIPGPPRLPSDLNPNAPRRGSAPWRWLLPMAIAGAAIAYVATTRGRAPRTSASPIGSPSAGPTCFARLEVTDVPSNHDVYIFAGRAPVDVANVPVGPSNDFVATLDGFAPRRASIIAGTSWEKTAGSPRYELAVQLERGDVLWPTLSASPEAEATGVGTVHLVSAPQNAQIWWRIGASPRAILEHAPCHDVELLVARAGGAPSRWIVPPSAFTQVKPGEFSAQVRAR